MDELASQGVGALVSAAASVPLALFLAKFVFTSTIRKVEDIAVLVQKVGAEIQQIVTKVALHDGTLERVAEDLGALKSESRQIAEVVGNTRASLEVLRAQINSVSSEVLRLADELDRQRERVHELIDGVSGLRSRP